MPHIDAFCSVYSGEWPGTLGPRKVFRPTIIYLKSRLSRLCAGALCGSFVRPPGGLVRSFVRGVVCPATKATRATWPPAGHKPGPSRDPGTKPGPKPGPRDPSRDPGPKPGPQPGPRAKPEPRAQAGPQPGPMAQAGTQGPSRDPAAPRAKPGPRAQAGDHWPGDPLARAPGQGFPGQGIPWPGDPLRRDLLAGVDLGSIWGRSKVDLGTPALWRHKGLCAGFVRPDSLLTNS